jgi:hypothetical protein
LILLTAPVATSFGFSRDRRLRSGTLPASADPWDAFLRREGHPLFWDYRRRVARPISAPMNTLIDFSPLIAAYAVWLLIIWKTY